MRGVLIVAASCVGGALVAPVDVFSAVVLIVVGGAAGLLICWTDLS